MFQDGEKNTLNYLLREIRSTQYMALFRIMVPQQHGDLNIITSISFHIQISANSHVLYICVYLSTLNG